MDEKFSSELNERQMAVLAHTMQLIGSDLNSITYIKSEELFGDLYPIDLAIFEPTEFVDYYLMQTVGLSSYYLDNGFHRCELYMALPKNWRVTLDKEQYLWPLRLLLDIAYNATEINKGFMIGQVHLANKEEGQYSKVTDVIGGIIVLAEELPTRLYDEMIEGTYTRFLQVVPVTNADVDKIDEMGPFKFIEYELHNSNGPLFKVKIEDKKVEGIDKIIEHNEKILKNKKKD